MDTAGDEAGRTAGGEAGGTAGGPPGRGRRGAGPWITWAGMAVALVVGGVVGGAIVAATRTTGTAAPTPSGTGACDATAVANRNLPSVVTISATNGTTGGTGSGEVIRAEGYILTNNHVISVATDGGRVEVLFTDGHSAPATITGRDPRSDLAVIKVDGQPSLPVIPFGSSADVVVGQPVVALGAPLGLSNTVTSGIISALDRTIEVPGDNGQTALLVSALQTDAAINPGNSGGALVNCNAQLIGVPSAGATVPSTTRGGGGSQGNIGLGFAIPADLARSISDEIIATGTVTHSYFGLSAVTVPAAGSTASGHQGGSYVTSVVPGGPAARAGLNPGDIVTAIDGKPVTGTDDLAAVTLTRKPGQAITVEYTRGGRPATTTLTLGTAP